ncbi:phosphonoacetaldehyde hydrolase [Scopulibacillus cellulosilyticus]|uniref:Phosphonoacetaldehyde hydrolase n=1 Tax=Scopulibacillus cellulosilyticus TaxID=2665665 RepID=A0ABW2PTY2_9BACL
MRHLDNHVKAVIFDWGGTLVDYGCMAPVEVFIEIFNRKGIEITLKEAREPMGLEKMDHIRTILNMNRINNMWVEKYNRQPDEQDIHELYGTFEPILLEKLPQYSEPVPGAINSVNHLKKLGIKIGTTTGYNRKMMEVVAPIADKKGLKVDSIVTSDEVPKGRPHPWMCYQNAINLQVYPMSQLVKVGDTVNDIIEGINAGMWTVGIIKGGSELGLSEDQIKNVESVQLNESIKSVERKFYEAGADFVIEDINELTDVIDRINDMIETENLQLNKK